MMKRITLQELEEQYLDAYNFLITHNMSTLKEQRYNLNNRNYVNVESYNTFSYASRRYESHRKYIDIQYVIEGEEKIVVKPISHLRIAEKYDPNRDIVFYQNNVKGVEYVMRSGDILLLEPEDGHMPCVKIRKSSHVKKAVFKFAKD